VTSAAYDAGLFDGEGWISPYRKRGIQQNVFVGLASTHYPSVAALLARYGGSVCQRKRTVLRRKDVWTWTVTGRRAAAFLVIVRPYLVIKLSLAADAIAFLRLRFPREVAA
jgi:hypothetical protein